MPVNTRTTITSMFFCLYDIALPNNFQTQDLTPQRLSRRYSADNITHYVFLYHTNSDSQQTADPVTVLLGISEEILIRPGALEVKVRLMLPGKANSPVHLDVLLGAEDVFGT